jgi:hypothetical protein
VSGYVFETNNTGTFVNGTWAKFSDFASSTSAYASMTKILSSARYLKTFRAWIEKHHKEEYMVG